MNSFEGKNLREYVNSTVCNNFNKSIPTIKSQQLFLFQIMTTLEMTFITFFYSFPFSNMFVGSMNQYQVQVGFCH